MTKAQVLLPSADVLEALARVLTVQADGRAEQKLLKKAEINRKTRKIAKMPRFILLPFPPKKTARRFNAGENAAGSKVPPGRLNGFHGNRFLSQGISAVLLSKTAVSTHHANPG